MLQTINYLNTNGTNKHKMNNKNQHVWKQWSQKKLQEHKKLWECKFGMGFITQLKGKSCHFFCNLQN